MTDKPGVKVAILSGVSVTEPDNRECNARIIELANCGQSPAEIARELGFSPGVVLGVLHRVRESGGMAPKTKAQTTDGEYTSASLDG